MKLVIISAVSINGVIGKNNEIPWHIPEDFKHYKETTMGHTIIVGYNTYITLPKKALEGRTYLVLGGRYKTHINDDLDNVHIFNDLGLLLDYIKLNYLHLDETIHIAGGEMLYKTFIEDCEECIITWAESLIDFLPTDNIKYFPTIELSKFFYIDTSTEWLTSVKGINYKIVKYKRTKQQIW